jgi:hypothetical protein
MEWKWSKGETYKRSKRIFNNENNQQSEEYYQKEIYEADIKNKQLELSAYSSSLNYDENTWDILNQSLVNKDFRQTNKREETDKKLADRELVQQCGFNPFLENGNYVDDIAVRDKFLKPINTTTDKITNN